MNATAAEAPPPGTGFCTVTDAAPAAATSAAVTVAVSCVPLTYVVVKGVPFQSTTEPAINPLPAMVKGNAAAPATAEVGEMAETVGRGLFGARARLLVRMYIS